MTVGSELEDIGQTVAGRYQVEEVLGRGGMGAVYRVRDARTGNALALKRGHARDPRRAQRRRALLEREYHTLAQLAHPRIIEVFDYGVDERGPFYTMELLDGADLNAKGPIGWKDACVLLRDVASSLAILHSRGLIHRDVSARNVRRTADGHAKLIDFGAMASMGVTKDVVGTPPFVPPEALQMQALDARVDLYSLGALGYYLLTARHAYPARRLSELRDTWRSAPQPPQRLVAELPHALSVLIMQLLSLDRAARPESAAEVMKRLCAIAGFSDQEQAAVSRAYLTAPALVGRDPLLLLARKRMLSLARGDGGSLLIEGVSGSGRSRMLDACVLEAKLAGATVIRADANDSAAGDWGVARTLGAQLLELMPKPALDAARFSRDVLGHVLDSLRNEVWPPLSHAIPERGLIIRELRDFVLSLSRQQRLVIAIDDADRIDEASHALLAALAHKAERNPLLVIAAVASESKHDAPASLRFLRLLSLELELPPLSAEETERMLRSVFGDTSTLHVLAARIHAISHGSPRAAMELAQHLVSKGLARYEAGSWSLPRQLEELELPATLSASLASRLDELSADARALAEVLALSDGDGLTVVNYPALAAQRDKKRVFRALDELVSARVLIADAERYRFSQRGFLAVVQASMPPQRKAQLHARIAELLAESGGESIARAEHLLHAGRDREAVELLCGVDLLTRLSVLSLALLEQAVAAAERLALPFRVSYRLRVALFSKASLALATPSFMRAALPLLKQLEQDSGLTNYAALEGLEPSERLTQAITQTQRKYSATPEDERGFPVLDSIRELARLSSAFCSMARPVLDADMLEVLPSLEPLVPLSPALEVTARVVVAAKDWLAGRNMLGAAGYQAVLDRIARPDRAGLDDVQHARMRLGINYGLGLHEASLGMARSAEERASILESDRELRLNAWRVRMVLHLAQGNVEEARKCQRRGELLLLQEGARERYLGATVAYELMAYSLADDLRGVESSRAALEPLALQHPGWKPTLIFAHARQRQLECDLEGALAHTLEGLALARPGKHAFFVYFAGLHIDLVGELGRDEEAAALARDYLELAGRAELLPPDHLLNLAAGQALVRQGEQERGIALIERAIEAAEQLGRSALPLGVMYEARARAALRCSDRQSFDRAAECCAREFAKARSPVLSLKFAALMNEARQQQVVLGAITAPSEALDLISATQHESEFGTVNSRIAECIDESDRARCALTILLQSLESFSGYLYGIDGDRLAFLAGLPDGAPDAGFEPWLRQRLLAELDAAGATASADQESGMNGADEALRFVDNDGRSYEAIMLVSEQSRPQRAAAMLALQIAPGPRTPSSRNLLAEIAEILLARGDVTGAVL